MSQQPYDRRDTFDDDLLIANTATILLTPRDLAERWSWSAAHLANLRSAGTGPAYRKIGRNVRYALADIEAYERSAFVGTDQQPECA